MYSSFQLFIKYLRYKWSAYNGRGHGMHSPFVYAMIREVFMDKQVHVAYAKPEVYRKKLLHDDRVLEIEDFGAGSVSGKTKHRKVSDIAKTSVKPRRYSRLIYRIAAFYGCRNIIELGTSLGVTSSYLAQVPGLENLVTMEGAEAVADIAEQELKQYGKVAVIRGEFQGELQNRGFGVRETNLDYALSILPKVDLAFIDGNHRLIPTLQYFETILSKTHADSIIIFDDIHWSAEMEQAWEKIRKDERVKLSIDLFFIGIVFFKKEFREKQHFSISF